jgi:hypothetical protein
MARPPSLTPTELSAAIQRLLEPGLDAISFCRHARNKARRWKFSTRDVEHVLRIGSVDDAIWKEDFRNWTYRLRGTDLDDEELTIVVAVDPAHTRITIITGFRHAKRASTSTMHRVRSIAADDPHNN